MDFYFYHNDELHTSTLQVVVMGREAYIPAVSIDRRMMVAIGQYAIIDRDDVKIYMTESDARSERPTSSTYC